MEIKPKVYFILGGLKFQIKQGPGAGKGTQSIKLVMHYGFVHLSAGDLLRAERKSGSKNGDLIEHYIKEGRIVPSQITVRLLEDAMRIYGFEKSFIIDGFPRNQENYEEWLKQLGDKVEFKSLLFFDCSEESMLKRIMERSESSGRVDDNIESLKKRFAVYQTETKSIIDHFREVNQVIIINAEGTPEQVFKDLEEKLKQTL